MCCDLTAQVDQANFPAPLASFNLRNDPRQEFTPSLDALDSVQLSLSLSPAVPVPRGSGTLAVAIRAGGVNGPIIGTSEPENFSLYRGIATFRFSQPVRLVPGNLYALQPIRLAGDIDCLIDGNPGYPGGRLFFNGSFDDHWDLVFMEGIAIPEPSSVSLLIIAVVVVCPILLWRATRNETD